MGRPVRSSHSAEGARNPRSPGHGGPELRVAILLMPEFTLLAYASFVEALRIAADERDNSRQIYCSWSILSPDDKAIMASCGARIQPQERLRDPVDFDYIVVVGGLIRGHRAISDAYYRYISDAHARGVCVIGLCTGSFVLARAGLLGGRKASVHWYHETEFHEEFPDIRTVSDEIFVIAGKVITCVGGTSSLDLAVHLINAHCGIGRALKSLEFAVVERVRDNSSPLPRGSSYRSDVSAHPLVRRAVAIMNQTISEPISISDLAAQLNLSPRQLERIFRHQVGMSPNAYQRKVRLSHGDWLIRNSNRPMTDIAVDCGFADASHFSRCYRQEFGHQPTQARSGDSA